MSRTPFRPSTHGWPFSNGSVVGTPLRIGRLPVGRVIAGLCGGMCLSAYAGWLAEEPLPDDRRTALRTIFGAQLRSFDIPRSPARYFALQQPSAATHRARATAAALDQIQERLDGGLPTMIGLVCALSRSPLALTRHHVCLVYDATPIADGISLAIYDPNHPRRDDVRLIVRGTQVTHSRGRRVEAIFTIVLDDVVS